VYNVYATISQLAVMTPILYVPAIQASIDWYKIVAPNLVDYAQIARGERQQTFEFLTLLVRLIF